MIYIKYLISLIEKHFYNYNFYKKHIKYTRKVKNRIPGTKTLTELSNENWTYMKNNPDLFPGWTKIQAELIEDRLIYYTSLKNKYYSTKDKQ